MRILLLVMTSHMWCDAFPKFTTGMRILLTLLPQIYHWHAHFAARDDVTYVVRCLPLLCLAAVFNVKA
jgi:hypothetical protein